jgi:3-oxoacyl-[acyl-carrier-protein] synthase II
MIQDLLKPVRVMVTGLGAITPLGFDVDLFWDSLVSGHNEIRAIKSFDASPFTCRIGGEVVDFDPSEYMYYRDVKRNDRFIHFAVAAARKALADAELSVTDEEKLRAGVKIGSIIGGMTIV